MSQSDHHSFGVPVLGPEDLAGMDIVDLSDRKGALLVCPETRELAEQYRKWYTSKPFTEGKVYFREDPRWLAQWTAVRSEVKRRRREHSEPVWTVVANVVRDAPFGPGGAEAWPGLKHFNRGAKVYAVGTYWQSPIVIGRWRGAGKWTKAVVRVDRLENFRTRLAYDTLVIDGYVMHWGKGRGWDEERARAMEEVFKAWKADIGAHREETWAGWLPLSYGLQAALGGAVGKALHWVDLRLSDGTVRMRVPMRHTMLHESEGIDPEQITDARPSAVQPDWTWE